MTTDHLRRRLLEQFRRAQAKPHGGDRAAMLILSARLNALAAEDRPERLAA